MHTDREVYALVYAYLLKRDVWLAERYRKLTKAESLHENSPTLERVVECFLRSSKTARWLKKDTGWGQTSQDGKGGKAQTPQSSHASVSNWHSLKKRIGRSPLPDLHPNGSTEFSRGSAKYAIGETHNYGTGKMGLGSAVGRCTKSVKKADAQSAKSCRKSRISTPVKPDPDPTWTPRRGRCPRVPPAAESPPECSDSEWDSGVDDQCSIYSSVSIRRGADTTDDLPTAPGDEWIHCDQCGRLWEDGDCLLHGPPISVPDSAVPASTPVGQRAARSVPAVLRVGPSGVHRGGLGVWARRPLQAGLRFGPYRGRRETNRARASAGGCSWEVHRDERLWFCVDAADPARANWMRYVNCAPSAEQENVTAYQHRWRIWYRTCRPIPRGTELLVYYGDEYKQELAREAAGKRRRC